MRFPLIKLIDFCISTLQHLLNSPHLLKLGYVFIKSAWKRLQSDLNEIPPQKKPASYLRAFQRPRMAARALLNCGLGLVTRVAVCYSCLGDQSLTARCSLIAAAVTGACITHLSELLSSAHLLFRWNSTPRSHHACIYVLTGRPYKTSEVHAHAGDGDKSWPSRFPSVSHGMESSTSHLPLADGSAGCAAVLSGDRDCRMVWFSPVDQDGEQICGL